METQNCLKSLAFQGMDDRSKTIEAAAPETCEWLLEHEKYTNWTTSSPGMLWIKGKPGSGKSTLLRYALDNITAVPSFRDTDIVLSFFLHGRGAPLQRTPVGLFRSLLHQLLLVAPDGLADLVTTFQEWSSNAKKTPNDEYSWVLNEMQGFLKSALHNALRDRAVWVFIDALDESGATNARDLVRKFKSLLQEIPPSCRPLRICFTCRHYPLLDPDCRLSIQPEKENWEAISTYVRARLSESPKLSASNLSDLVTNRANGVFMWARLVVDKALELDDEGVGLRKIEAAVKDVPKELEDLYTELVQDMRQDPLSLRLIRWICCALRPLSLEGLRWAMVVYANCPYKSLQQCQDAEDLAPDNGTMEKKLKTLSRGLAEAVQPSSDSVYFVQFIHQSVKDFIVDKGLSILTDRLEPSEPKAKDTALAWAHYQLSRTCVRYLAMEEIHRRVSSATIDSESDNTMAYDSENDNIIWDEGDCRDFMSEFPLLHYALVSWAAHAKHSEMRGIPHHDLLDYLDPALFKRLGLISRALSGSKRYIPWLSRRTQLLHVVSQYALLGPLRRILDEGAEIDVENEVGQTPMLLAALGGHEAVVQLLIDNGAEINVHDYDGHAPLLYAALSGDEPVVNLLIDKGADIDWQNKNYETALLLGSKFDYASVVTLLLNRGAKVDISDIVGYTPLLLAAKKGHESIVQLLLDNGASIDMKDNDGKTPLSWAAEHGHQRIVQILLDRGADIDMKDDEGKTPLSCAAESGHESIVQILLDNGAGIDIPDIHGCTPLLWAFRYKHVAIVKLLVGKGAAVEMENINGETPLSVGKEPGNEAILRLLTR